MASIIPLPWTPEREADAKRMFLAGDSYTKIAKTLGGVTRNAVCGKLHRMGVFVDQRAAKETAVAKLGAAGLMPSASERRASGGALTRKLMGKSPDPIGLPKWAADAVASGAAPIEHLTSNQCRWPLGPVLEPSSLFCGEPKRDADCPYCARHAARAFVASDTSKARRSDQHVVALTKRYG